MYTTKIIIDKVEWINDIPKVYIVKVDENFEVINKENLYLDNDRNIEEMFIIFKNELVVGYGIYKLFYYIIEYLKDHKLKDYFFTYLDLKRIVTLDDSNSLLENIKNDEKIMSAVNYSGLAIIYYRPLYNRVNKPFLLESLFVSYRGSDLYILYDGENRELHCFLQYYIIQDIDAYTEDVEKIKHLGGKIVVKCGEFNLEIAKYIDELYMNYPTTIANNNWIDDFYFYIKSKKKYRFKIYYESISNLNKLLYNYDEGKRNEIIDYITKYGIMLK